MLAFKKFKNRARSNVISEPVGQTLEYRDHETSFLACFSAYLNSLGINISLDDILSLAPIPKGKISSKNIRYCARRIGIDIERIENFSISTVSDRFPILLQRQSSYSFLIWKFDGKIFQVSLPGFSKPYTDIGIDADVLQKVGAAYFLKIERPYIWGARKRNCQKLWLIPWLVEYGGIYASDAVCELRRQLGVEGRHIEPPGKLEKLNISAIMDLHLLMCPKLPKHYGVLRKINLRRDGIFVDHKSIESALNLLVNVIIENISKSKQDPITFAAFLLTDFLSIHPFINGNRRIAMRIVDFIFQNLIFRSNGKIFPFLRFTIGAEYRQEDIVLR